MTDASRREPSTGRSALTITLLVALAGGWTLAGCSGKAPERSRGGITVSKFRAAFSNDSATADALTDGQLRCVADSLFGVLPVASVKAVAADGLDAVTASTEDQQFTASALSACVPLSVWIGSATQGLTDAQVKCIDADKSLVGTDRLELWTALVAGAQPSDAVMKSVDTIVAACIQT